MITINLMPDDGSKKGRKGAPAPGRAGGGDGGSGGSLLVLIAVLVAVLINGGLGWHFYSEVEGEKQKVVDLRAKGADIQKKIDSQAAEAKQLARDLNILQNQQAVLDSLDPANRVLWAEKLNMLADLTPPDVFINQVEVTEDIKMVETEASKKSRADWRKKTTAEKEGTKEPKQLNRPQITYHMAVEGLATGRDNIEQFNNMLAFVEAMRNYKRAGSTGTTGTFMEGFQPNMDFKGFEATTYEDVPVHKFTYVLTTNDQSPPPPAPAAAASESTAAATPGATKKP